MLNTIVLAAIAAALAAVALMIGAAVDKLVVHLRQIGNQKVEAIREIAESIELVNLEERGRHKEIMDKYNEALQRL